MPSIVHIFKTLVNFLRGTETIAIEEQSDFKFVVRHGSDSTTFDLRSKVIVQNNRVAAPLTSVSAVEIGPANNGDGPPIWEVVLRLSGFGSIRIGYSTDDVEASISAAYVAKKLDCEVQQR